MILLNASKRTGYQFTGFILICLISLTGCESLVNDLGPDELPKIESRLAVECYISPQSARLEAVVTESQPLFGRASYDAVFVKNAEVILSGDTQKVRLVYDDSTTRYYADTSAFKVEAGKSYTLTVTDGKRSVRASTTVPVKRPTIKKFTVKIVPLDYSPDSIAQIRFSWEDIKGESNYYTVRGYAIAEETVPQYNNETGDIIPFRLINRWPFYYRDWNTFNDTNLDGITYNAPEYNVRIPQKRTVSYLDKNGVARSFYNDALLREVRAEVLNVDVNYYRFYNSLDNAGGGDNPFVEPTLVYTNIEGGLGCFGSYTVTSATINP
ncbi:DUF4249 domain-containing protein [Dyadobacter sp. CY323]|uniref:DUF4249 domain-containing protein n=1 Tax=Dyadobacter sp. CY323 TaxID=2907302 RepID=UPI001F33DB84|nr:DUF4249 domain-containing protein [Dyadobacter sp. CY323]MCE6987941.1 DUF4249 domain-containing protein [Dyadobacter sp. CY323]